MFAVKLYLCGIETQSLPCAKQVEVMLLAFWPPALYIISVMSVCLTVCQITCESLDIRHSYLYIRYISRECRSDSYMKVIGSGSRSQEQKRLKNPYPLNLQLWMAVTPILSVFVVATGAFVMLRSLTVRHWSNSLLLLL